MRLTIIADDDTVLIDGDARRVDCAVLRAAGVHAVQWDGAAGAVELKIGPQVGIASTDNYAQFVAAHAARKLADEAAAAEAQANAPPARNVLAELDALAARVSTLEAKP